MKHGVAAAVAVLLGAVPAVSQDKAPDPGTLMRDATAAVAKASPMRFEAVAEGVGALASRSPRITAEVRAQKAPEGDPFAWRFGASGEIFSPGSEAKAPFAAAYDGSVFRTTRASERVVLEGEAASARPLLDEGAGWVLAWLVRWDELVANPFADPGAEALSRYEGVTDVEGVRCHVVYADYSELSDPRLFGAWWFLGVDDALPRRVEMHYLDDEFGDGFARVTLRNVRAGSTEGPSFTMEPPDGYELKKHEAQAQARARAPRPAPPQKAAVGQPAPAVALKDPAGNLHDLAAYKGKVVVLDFWATWCGPCRAAMPGVQRLHEKFKGQKVAVFGVNCWENGDPAAYMKKEGFTYGLLLEGDAVAQAYGVTGIPAFFIVGPDGKILHQAGGFDPTGAAEKQMEKIIEEALRAGG